MKVIGFSAGSIGREGNVDRMVKAILDKSGHEVEFVKLTDLTFSDARAVSNCVRARRSASWKTMRSHTIGRSRRPTQWS